MKNFVALICAWSIVMVSPAALAAHASAQNPPERREADRDFRRAAAPRDEAAREIDGTMRRALADEVRSLAGIQVLRPTTSPSLWDLLGSNDGVDWKSLGSFRLLEGEIPPPRTGTRVPMRFVVGEARLTSGREISNVVASVADVGGGFLFPEGSLLFYVHRVAEDRAEAVSQSVGVASEVKPIGNLDLGDATSFPEIDSHAPPLARGQATAGDLCRASCDSVRDKKIDLCAKEGDLCAGAATAGLGLCLLVCAGVGCPVCLAAYAAALGVCGANKSLCETSAQIDYDACVNGCPADSPEPIVISCAPDCGSPIVINLGGKEGFQFTDAPGGVLFDLDADGIPNNTAWTFPGHDQAFLALDRNANGIIDDGGELFGDATVQPSSAAPHGFRALAVFDQEAAGGDEDGRIEATDAVFGMLRLWIDANHDGVSQPEELSSLSDAGIESLSLDYVVANRRDRHGNLLRYKALVRMKSRVVESVDVFFVQGEALH